MQYYFSYYRSSGGTLVVYRCYEDQSTWTSLACHAMYDAVENAVATQGKGDCNHVSTRYPEPEPEEVPLSQYSTAQCGEGKGRELQGWTLVFSAYSDCASLLPCIEAFVEYPPYRIHHRSYFKTGRSRGR